MRVSEADLGWFMRYNFFAPSKAKAISAEVNKLCLELRPRALPLVEAFQIPSHLVQAPIALPESEWWIRNDKGGEELS